MSRMTSHTWCLIAFVLLLSAPLLTNQPDLYQSIPRGLHPMPPHPALLEELEREGSPLPDLSRKVGRGIDQPYYFPNPPTGNFNLLVVAVDFSDHTGSVAASFFDNLIFAPPGPGLGSVADYYFEISYGAFTLTTVNLPGVLNWQRAPNPYNGAGGYVNADGIAGTGDDYGWGAYPQNLQGIVADVIPLIDPLVDFSQYDNDGDGFVESVVFVHAGRGAEITVNPNDIWSSAWNMTDSNGPGPLMTQEGVWVDNFTFDPEFMNIPGDQTVGVYCHELGHTLFGLPDLYDYDLSSNGVGSWSLMGYGSWNGSTPWVGDSPAWPDAWSRIQMGFDQPYQIDGTMTSWPFTPVEQMGGPGIGVVKLQPPQLGAGEYFLVEHRAQLGFDQYLPWAGLLVWHVDESKWNNWELNTDECSQSICCQSPCDVKHPLVALEQADGLLDLENAVNYGDPGDPFPGLTGNNAFGFGTSPESGSYYASPCPSNSCVSIQNISAGIPGLIMADVSAVCQKAVPCLNILLDEPAGWGQPGTEVTYRATVRNCGNAFDFAVTLYAASDWPMVFYDLWTGQPIPPPPSAGMFPGQAWSVGISVTVPSEALWGVSDVLTMTAVSSFPGVYTTSLMTTSVPYCVLVVDDDQGSPDVESAYTTALANGNYDFDYWDVNLLGSPDLGALAAHQAVVWFTGTPSRYTIHPREEYALARYLDSGGGLFLSSQEYITDTSRTAFNLEYLRVATYTNDTGTNMVTGIAGNPVGDGLGPYPFTVPAALSDRLTPLSPAGGAFVDFMGLADGLTYNSGAWKTLFLAWPFENLAQADADELMASAMSWLAVPPQPVVDFIIDPVIALVGEVVTFTNNSLDATAFSWDFGDGVTDTLTDTTHVYTASLTVTVTLMGRNCCGYAAAQRSLSVFDMPVAGFIPSDTEIKVGEVVTFTNTSLNASSYTWDFGDGIGTSTQTHPAYIYTSAGWYTVTLTASNPAAADIYTSQVRVGQYYYLPLLVKGSSLNNLEMSPQGHWGGGVALFFVSLAFLGITGRASTIESVRDVPGRVPPAGRRLPSSRQSGHRRRRAPRP